MFTKQCENSKFKRQRPRPQSESWNYDYDVYDEDLRDDINKARVYAKNRVDEFFKTLKDTSKVAAEGAWDGAYGYIIGGIVATIIFVLARACH